MKKRILVLLVSVFLVFSCGSGERDPSQVFVDYLNEMGDILANNVEQPENAGPQLQSFLDRNREEYNAAVSHVNNLDHEEKKAFLLSHNTELQAGLDKMWETFNAYLDNDQVNSLLDSLNQFDLTAYNEAYNEIADQL